jgi:ATP-dependent helicase/nuclease subunit A
VNAAYRLDGQPASREAFYATACDPRRHVCVEACAGAGKTWMLVARIVRALLDGALPHEILAITFTRKAAGEMRTRLNNWLREASTMTPAQAASKLRQFGLDAAQAEQRAAALNSGSRTRSRCARCTPGTRSCWPRRRSICWPISAWPPG